jgi:hypothetical protein
MKIRLLLLALLFVVLCNFTAFSQDNSDSRTAVTELKSYLEDPAQDRAAVASQEFVAIALTQEDAEAAKQLLWADHVERIQASRKDEMDARQLTLGDLHMPFFYSVSGEKPEAGRSLYISMHGGGGAPARVNDQQWENQKQLYRIEEGVYLAPRAPTDSWNLWHQGHIDEFFDRLIENLIVLEDVDPNRVYLMGYSAGGDGVYQLAPRMADRFAAVSMMAGHPNEASPLGLRNLPFTLHVGALDAGYNRNKIAQEWGERLDVLQEADPEGYVHWAKLHEGKGHWMDRQDAEALPWMAQYTRNPFPTSIVWRQDDVTHSRFYWLAVAPEDQQRGNEIRASLENQTIDIESSDVSQLTVRVNDQMLDMDESIAVTSGGTILSQGVAIRTIGVMAETLEERGDLSSVFSGEIVVTMPSE